MRSFLSPDHFCHIQIGHLVACFFVQRPCARIKSKHMQLHPLCPQLASFLFRRFERLQSITLPAKRFINHKVKDKGYRDRSFCSSINQIIPTLFPVASSISEYKCWFSVLRPFGSSFWNSCSARNKASSDANSRCNFIPRIFRNRLLTYSLY